MKLSEFNYYLPKELIAQHPARPRDDCRLMVLHKDKTKDKIVHERFFDIIKYLNKGDVLVMNSTKVIQAKLVGNKSSGSSAEIILTKEIDKKKNIWECRIKTRNPHPGVKIFLDKGYGIIMEQISIDRFKIRLSNKKLLQKAILPNPPYIKHDVTSEEYQTIYAKHDGSLAAPTAGLHFTKTLLKKIKDKGVKIAFVRLHVGFGTFLQLPEDIKNLKTEPEYFEIPENTADLINRRKGRLFVVGTTTLKALESSSEKGKIIPSKGYSDIFVRPGHIFSCGADALLTNFHLPKSSLILLTCAFGGSKKIINAYSQAIRHNYRFYSLGDAMLIEK